MPQSRSGRTKARSGAKQVAQDGEAEKKKTFIVKVPAKTSEVTSSVFDSEPSLATAGERAADSDFTQTIILQEEEERASGGAEDQSFSEFSIPIDMVGGGDKGDFDQDLYGRISLSDQLSLNTSDLSQAGDIRNHVISIEENGRITIGIDQQYHGGAGNLSTILEEPLVTPKQPHTPPKFPEWWLRLSSTLLSFLSTGYLVDVWLVCCDGEAVPAHQLLLSHASPRLASWLEEAARDTQEEAVTVSLPDWDSDTVGQFVSALYQGQLPALRNSQEKIRELADVLGINLQRTFPRSTSIVRKNLPKVDARQVIVSSNSTKFNASSLKSEFIKKEPSNNVDQPLGPMQIVQTESGQILLLTGDLNNFQQDNVETKVDPISIPERITSSYQTDEEVEKIKAVKIAEIKEQQGKQCPICYNTAINHRETTAGAEQKFAYKCCHTDCNVDNLKTARAFNQHITRHNGLNAEPASKVCPLCMRPRIEHKNRSIAEEDKGNHRGNLYKCCHCMASKLSAKKFFLHMENHVSKKHVCDICNKGYSYKHLLNEHHYKEHGEGQDVRYPCEFEGCDYSAKYKQTLHTHVMERHHGIKRKHRQTDAYKRINCPTCGKTLKQWYYHQFHKKSCTLAVGGGTLFQCELCGKEGFINAVTLENHKRTKHSVERPFACEYCPAKYATAMSLSGHRYIHPL